MKSLLLIAALQAGQWLPREPVELSAEVPHALEQSSGQRLLLRVDPADVPVKVRHEEIEVPLRAGPDGTFLVPAGDTSRTLTLAADGEAELLSWRESHVGEPAAWDRYEHALYAWAREGGELPPAPGAIPALETRWKVRREALRATGEHDPAFLFHTLVLDLEQVRARGGADHGETLSEPRLVTSGESLDLEVEGPGTLDLSTRVLMDDEAFRRFEVSLLLDDHLLRREMLVSTADDRDPAWSWARSLPVSVPPGDHVVRLAYTHDHQQELGVMEVTATRYRLRPSLDVLLSVLPRTRLLPWSRREVGPVMEMLLAFMARDPEAVVMAEELLGSEVDTLARAWLVERIPDPEQALSLYNAGEPTPRLVLALARRWQRWRDVNPTRLLMNANEIPTDPELLADLADAISGSFVRPRGRAIRSLAGVSVLGKGASRWTQLIPEQRAGSIRVSGLGGGVNRILVPAGGYATVTLPDPTREGRYPVIRIEAEDWTRYRVDGQPRSGVGDLSEALSPGTHRVDVDEGELLLLDGALGDGGLPVRDRSAGSLPNAWRIPDPGAPTEVALTIHGPAADLTVTTDTGEAWTVHHDPPVVTPAAGEASPASPSRTTPILHPATLTELVLPISPQATQVEVHGPASVQVALSTRRTLSEEEIPLPSPWPDPMATLGRASRDLVLEPDESPDLGARPGLRTLRAAALQALGLPVSAQSEARAVAASPWATPAQRARAYALYQSTLPPVHTARFPGPVTVAAALAQAGIRMPHPATGEAMAEIALSLEPPVSWPLHREASALFLEENDVVRAWVQANLAGPLGHVARLRALSAGQWDRIPRMDRNGGTLLRQIPRNPPDSSDGLYSLAREEMLGAPWPGETYSVARQGRKAHVRFEGAGQLHLELLYRDESFAVQPSPWSLQVQVDGQSHPVVLEDARVQELHLEVKDGEHEVVVGPIAEDDRALLVRAHLDGELLPPQVVIPVHRLGRNGAEATVAGPCLLRVRVHEGGPVRVQVEGESREVEDVRVVAVRGTGAVPVEISGPPEATITLSRMRPCPLPHEPGRPLPEPLDTSAPSVLLVAATDHWMRSVANPAPRLLHPMESTGTAEAHLEMGDDSTGVRDTHTRYRYLESGARWRQRFEGTRTWFEAWGQGRASPDGAPGAHLGAELVMAPGPHATRGVFDVGSSAEAGHLRLMLHHRRVLPLGTWWKLQPYLDSWFGAWTPAVEGTVDPVAWNRFSARHPFGVRAGSLLDWRPLRDGRLRLDLNLYTNPDLLPDHTEASLRLDVLAREDLVVRFGPEVGYRFRDDWRSQPYWRAALVGGADLQHWQNRNWRFELSALGSWYVLEGTAEGRLAFTVQRSPVRGLRDTSPLDQVFKSALDLPLEMQ